jgi:hypothetical protein
MPSVSRRGQISLIAPALAWMRAQTLHVASQIRHVGPKGAATANLVALLLVTIGMPLWQPSFGMSRDSGPVQPLAPAPAAVKMIDAAPRGVDCREQTWPYIDRHCLNYGKAQPEIAAQGQPQSATAPKPETSGHAPSNVQPPVQQTRIAPAAPVDAAPPRMDRSTSEPSTDDVRVADDEPVEYAPTEEELRAQARAEARQRRRARHHRGHGHFWIGPFRF